MVLMDVKSLKEVLRQYVSEPFPPWEEYYLEYHGARYLDTLAVLGPGKGRRLLDVGAFPGHLSLLAHSQGFQVEGLTGRAESPGSLEMIKKRLAKHQIPMAMADVENEAFPYSDESFDTVLASEIIEHLHFNPFHLLREAFRILKPGGRLVLSTPNLTRLENMIRLLKDRSVHADISRNYYEAFSSIISARHVREYTASELTYLLEDQNKEIYRFEKTRFFFSSGLDPIFRWPKLAGLVLRLWPRFRSTLICESFRPLKISLISPGQLGAEGFYPAEVQGPNTEGIARMFAVPFRWTRQEAEIRLPASQAEFQVFSFHAVYLAPVSLQPAVLTLGAGEKILGKVRLNPAREFTPLRVVLPIGLADKGQFVLHFSCPTWRPTDHQGKDDYEFSLRDERDLGVALAWDGILRDDCQDLPELLRLIEKDWNRPDWIQGPNPCWIPAHPNYLLLEKRKTFLRMGTEDLRQLGPGWHPLESWANGFIRWSSGLAEAYLSSRPKARRLKVRVFTGDWPGSEKITGNLELDWISDKLLEGQSTGKAFRLPPGIWTDVTVDLPLPIPSDGVLHVVLRVNPLRIPACLIPGSQDRRELGLAVAGMSLD
jgi:2-polyprenyl-3-methyl-5-hydroxy-6-metoxy-1,4-benzoquinol methylase